MLVSISDENVCKALLDAFISDKSVTFLFSQSSIFLLLSKPEQFAMHTEIFIDEADCDLLGLDKSSFDAHFRFAKQADILALYLKHSNNITLS